jgi:hypothetical protein
MNETEDESRLSLNTSALTDPPLQDVIPDKAGACRIKQLNCKGKGQQANSKLCWYSELGILRLSFEMPAIKHTAYSETIGEWDLLSGFFKLITTP